MIVNIIRAVIVGGEGDGKVVHATVGVSVTPCHHRSYINFLHSDKISILARNTNIEQRKLFSKAFPQL
jgi:hypothetical protein